MGGGGGARQGTSKIPEDPNRVSTLSIRLRKETAEEKRSQAHSCRHSGSCFEDWEMRNSVNASSSPQRGDQELGRSGAVEIRQSLPVGVPEEENE